MLSDRSLSGWKGWSGSFFSPSKQDEMRSPLLSNEFFASVQFNYSSDRKNFHACLLSRLPFSFSLPLLSRLMEMAFVPVNLYILFFWGSKIGSVLSPLPWFMHSYFHLRGIDVPRPSRSCSCFSFHIEFSFHVVLPCGRRINSVYRSQPSFLPARFALHSARLPFHLPFFNGGGRTLLPLR